MPLPDPKIKNPSPRPRSEPGLPDVIGKKLLETITGEITPEVPPESVERSGPSPTQVRRFKRIALELNKRGMEALALYEPMPKQLRFHQSKATKRMLRGSNRSGKSQCTGAEVAWAATGTHPWTKYPKENGIGYCVGWDHRHVAPGS